MDIDHRVRPSARALLRRTRPPAAAAGVVLAVSLALAACTSSHRGAGPAPSTTSGSSTSALTSPSTVQTTLPTVPSSTSSSSSSTPAGPVGCPTGSLRGALANENGAAGSIYYSLVLTNTGPTACLLQGYPGVSFVTGPGGQQVGAPAARGTAAAPAVALAPGHSSSASLQITEATNYGTACQVTAVAGLKVFPPGQTASLYVPHSDRACANTNDVTLHVGAFQPSS